MSTPRDGNWRHLQQFVERKPGLQPPGRRARHVGLLTNPDGPLEEALIDDPVALELHGPGQRDRLIFGNLR